MASWWPCATDGVSSFPDLQAALSEGRDDRLFFYLFDLLHLNGWDLRPCALIERKRALCGLADWRGTLRYSDHSRARPHAMRRQACAHGAGGDHLQAGRRAVPGRARAQAGSR